MSFDEKNLFFMNTFRSSLDVSKYEIKIKIGWGAYGEVSKGVNLENGQEVAMKKIRVKNKPDGFPTTAMREIQILRSIKAENIIKLYEVCTSKPSPENDFSSAIYLILEFCEHDLAGLLSNKSSINFTLGEKKQILLQLFNGINFLHTNQIMHRDLKPANILMTKTGVLKIADFGSAKRYGIKKNSNDPSPKFTNPVVTFWYRAPELLLGNRSYGPIIDLWAAGCIMGQLWTRRPILVGKTVDKSRYFSGQRVVYQEAVEDLEAQLIAISQLCGSITPDVWPGLEDLGLYVTMNLPKNCNRQVKRQFQPFIKDDLGCDLLDKLLVVNHKERLDAAGALNHEFFTSEPLPCDLKCTLSQCNTSMLSMFTYGGI